MRPHRTSMPLMHEAARFGPARTRRSALWMLVLLLGVVTSIASPSSWAARKDDRVAIIAHPSVPVDSLEIVDLQRIYLSKRTRWPDDTRIVATMLKEGQVHRSFVEDVLEQRF
ncbi:MAG: hypothetical protein R3E97_14515 [Candidatus Eisenbacteria bacterium]